MRKLVRITALATLFVVAAIGQRGGMRSGGGVSMGPGARGGFGGGSHRMGGHGGGNRPANWPGRPPGFGRGGFYGRAGWIGGASYYPGYQPAFYGNWGSTYGYSYWAPSQGPSLGYFSWPGFYDSSYDASPNVVVIYPPHTEPVVTTVYAEPVKPVIHEYDFESEPQTESPIYLFAFKDQSIRAAASYQVKAGVLHYTTLDREEKQASLDTLDREFSLRLNRQRKVTLQLPQ